MQFQIDLKKIIQKDMQKICKKICKTHANNMQHTLFNIPQELSQAKILLILGAF